MDYEKEISFGAFDSELMHQEIFIPEGFTATIDGNKIILKKKESEDEKIRKAIIEFFELQDDNTTYSFVPKKDILAWLGKQGEHANFRNKIQVGDKVTRNKDGVLVNLSQLNRVAKKDEKQGEQNHIEQNLEMVEALRAEYEKGRADAFAQMMQSVLKNLLV